MVAPSWHGGLQSFSDFWYFILLYYAFERNKWRCRHGTKLSVIYKTTICGWPNLICIAVCKAYNGKVSTAYICQLRIAYARRMSKSTLCDLVNFNLRTSV